MHVDYINSRKNLDLFDSSDICAKFIIFHKKMETTNVEKGMSVFLDVRNNYFCT